MAHRAAALAAVLTLAALAGFAGPGCRSGVEPRSSAPSRATLRVYALGTIAGALEPCGCVKDMLGGMDHAAAFVRADAAGQPATLLIGAGPMLFLDPALPKIGDTQQRWKAQAIAESFRDLSLLAWAPGRNDSAAGTSELARLERVSGATLLGGEPGAQPARVIEAGGQRVGLAAGNSVADLERAQRELSAAGAKIVFALLALPRGEALRLLDRVPGFDLAVLGKASDEGDANDAPTPPVLIGDTLVVQPPNHLQAIAVVDFHVADGDFHFQDGSGVRDIERRERLAARARELEQRLVAWEKPGSGAAEADVRARRQELSELERELDRPPAPSRPDGSFFTYRLVEVRERFGSDPAVLARMKDYYRRVNEHNREAYKDRLPPPVPPGASAFAGSASCGACHEEEERFWRSTPHSHAYATLERDNKQFNLDCVGCHVTGYEKPGGSTVTHVSRLENVGCEVCHGPGTLHASDPKRRDLIQRTPPRSLCASECHHPPHVKSDWDVARVWPRIVGPGHGAP